MLKKLLQRQGNLLVLLDTSSLMEPGMAEVLQHHLVPVVQETKRKIAVPTRVKDEVQKHCSSADPELQAKARRALQLIDAYARSGILGLYGDPGDPFADNVFLAVIMRRRLQDNFLLFTQDRGLASDALRINYQKSVKTHHRISAYCVGAKGELREWRLADGEALAHSRPIGRSAKATVAHKSDRRATEQKPITPTLEKFRLGTGAVQVNTTRLDLPAVPREGWWLVDGRGNRVVLRRQLGVGGEGAVYETDRDGVVCKIYKEHRLAVSTRDKLDLMIHKPVRHPGICWPQELVFLPRGHHFVGYTMAAASGKKLQSLLNRPLLQETFPHWNRLHLTTMLLSLLASLHALHERNVLLGDINPLNFLVQDEQTIFLVDTDSYQVEDFPCPVATPRFLAPELQGQTLDNSLRTFAHEYFAVATLVFTVLMPNQAPYAHRGGGSSAENVKLQHFPYSRSKRTADDKKKHGEGAPNLLWRKVWSHFPPFLNEAFHRVFTDQHRLSTAEWLDVIQRYLHYLQSHPQCGDESKRIWTQHFKVLAPKPGGPRETCTKCRRDFVPVDDRCKPGHPPLCIDCHEDEVVVQCGGVCGGQEFFVKYAQVAALRGKPPLCQPCREQPPMQKICRACNAQFLVNIHEQLYYRQNNLSLPERCRECRNSRRQRCA
jgi:rRNA-processing protein FCF1